LVWTILVRRSERYSGTKYFADPTPAVDIVPISVNETQKGPANDDRAFSITGDPDRIISEK
jgi:hypothetical protein